MNIKDILINLKPDTIRVDKLRGDASSRLFFRLHHSKFSEIAMVYPAEDTEATKKFADMAILYKSHGLNVPEIFDIINNRIILVEDLGDMLLQRCFRNLSIGEKKGWLERVMRSLLTLRSIPKQETLSQLNPDRMKKEMEFFFKILPEQFTINIKTHKRHPGSSQQAPFPG